MSIKPIGGGRHRVRQGKKLGNSRKPIVTEGRDKMGNVFGRYIRRVQGGAGANIGCVTLKLPRGLGTGLSCNN